MRQQYGIGFYYLSPKTFLRMTPEPLSKYIDSGVEKSIRAKGFKQPLVIALNKEGRQRWHEGRHRSYIAQKLRLSRVPVIIDKQGDKRLYDKWVQYTHDKGSNITYWLKQGSLSRALDYATPMQRARLSNMVGIPNRMQEYAGKHLLKNL